MDEKAKQAFRAAQIELYDEAYFGHDYWKEDLPGFSGNRGLSYSDADHKERFRLIAEAIAQHVEVASVLDAGCGTGLLAHALTAHFPRVAGIDSSKFGVEVARRLAPKGHALEFLQASVCSMPFESGQFDLVTCFDVLEHLPYFDVDEAVAELCRVAARHIVLTINTDNPYEFHPTILSPSTWRSILSSETRFARNEDLEVNLTVSIASHRPEYDFYCYSRI